MTAPADHTARVDRLCAMLRGSSPDEARACELILGRVFGIGREHYGPTDLTIDRRDFRQEGADELADFIWYAALEYLRREDARRAALPVPHSSFVIGEDGGVEER